MGDSYGEVADLYAEHFAAELAHKPLDRALLELVAAERPRTGPIADVGCGPGHVTRFLHDRGAPVVGVDASPGMVEAARRLNPGLDFREGSLLHLDVPDSAWSAIVAFYSIIHLRDDELAPAFRECARALSGGGLLLCSFHIGDGVVHRDEWWGRSVSLDFHMLTVDAVTAACAGAGLMVEMSLQRVPYTAVEGPTTRGYVLARKPGDSA